MIPFKPHEHLILRDQAAKALTTRFKGQRDLVVYRHVRTGAVVLAQLFGRTHLRELLVLAHWPNLSPADHRDLAHALAPNEECHQQSMAALRRDDQEKRQVQNDAGYKWREAYRKMAHATKRKYPGRRPVVNVPKLGE